MESFEKAVSLIARMIPATICVALVIGCANQELEQPPAITPSQREAAIQSALELLQTDQVKEALAITTSLISKDSSNSASQETHALALISQGWKLQEKRDILGANDAWEQALQAYIQACKHNSNPALLQLSTGQLAQMLQQYPVAIKFYTKSHAQNEQDARSSFFLSQIYLLQKDWNKAKEWLVESLQRKPNEPFALLSLALAEAELGNCEAARKHTSEGCSLLPNDATIRFVQSRVIRLCGNAQHAYEILLSLPKQFQQTPIFQDELDICKRTLEVENQ